MKLSPATKSERRVSHRVGFVTASASRSGGGLFDAMRGLALDLPGAGVTPQVFALRDAHTEEDLAQWGGVQVTTFDPVGPAMLGYSPQLREALLATDVHLIHTHGIWMHPSADVIAWHRRQSKPYIISPHGMLDPWILNRSRLKKWIALRAYERSHLNRAACFHALNFEEADAIRAAGLKQPIAVVPNGVVIHDTNGNELPSWWQDGFSSKNLLLYFGRLHPKKGIENLLSAWKECVKNGSIKDRWNLIVGGWGSASYTDKLRSMVGEGVNADGVHFIGSQFGADKARTYAACDCVILPSFSEGLPMVPLESWSFRKPVAITRECNLPIGVERGAAFEIGNSVEELRNFIVELCGVTDAQLREMGELGRSLAEEKFSWNAIAMQMAGVYNWLIGIEKKPAFVID
ncbi:MULTISPECIES: glycosyltransferase [unclassified Burkholderia]|uniref:glycosyltransferase n=1 Tax=unclassified Burkholderia TaxID=2613784 RepID=UPI000F567972|nr:MULTISPECIES: glycosyltransferase [unclassified Burkholderia]RQR30795.1 glycosyltransferase [Burkholderia sp. Bp9131]RQR63679.1 glycosyltransferase [Burkholderia sp. Bp9015]RQR73524.1 glycosyltransferase [Burkholderia sp. Bp9011]RQR85214.1 glycosyltransferase [Burkholderia sp. Bp9010]RQR96482.1 glycosyltransferase [Burkholderia sp. Bp8991]